MSRISRTRSAAAGIEAPASSASLHSEPLGNAAAAAKSRHSDLRQHQPEAKPQQQPPIMSADSTEQHSTEQHSADMPQVAGAMHQSSTDENMLASQSEAAKAPDGKIPLASGNPFPVASDSRAARTRSLPPKPTTARTRSTKPPAAKPAQTAAPAEHAVPEVHAAPSASHLSSTLAGIAQSLVTFSNNLHATPAHASDAVPEQIDMDLDFTNDSDDSDFQPGREPVQADDDVIDLSQEDPVDVVEHGDGSIAIRSPLQAAAVAAVEAGVGHDDDDEEEEFQQLKGKSKRKAAAKDASGGTSQYIFVAPCLLAHLPACKHARLYACLPAFAHGSSSCLLPLLCHLLLRKILPGFRRYLMSRCSLPCAVCSFNTAIKGSQQLLVWLVQYG